METYLIRSISGASGHCKECVGLQNSIRVSLLQTYLMGKVNDMAYNYMITTIV